MCRKVLPCGPLFSEGLTKFNILPAVFHSLWIVQRPVFKYNFVFVFLAKLECHNSLCPMKDLLYNHSTIWDWSEDQKWKKKNMNLISFKKCNMCTTSLYTSKKQLSNNWPQGKLLPVKVMLRVRVRVSFGVWVSGQFSPGSIVLESIWNCFKKFF